jgi:hypothetical protein
MFFVLQSSIRNLKSSIQCVRHYFVRAETIPLLNREDESSKDLTPKLQKSTNAFDFLLFTRMEERYGFKTT